MNKKLSQINSYTNLMFLEFLKGVEMLHYSRSHIDGNPLNTILYGDYH